MGEDFFVEFEYTNIPYLIICFFGAISHIFLLNGFIKDPLKCFKNSKTYLMANLEVADLSVCLIAFCYRFGALRSHRLLAEILLSLALGSSAVTIVSVSIDRYFMITYPIRHRNFMTGKVTSLWLACIWLISAVLPSKFLIFGNKKYDLIAASVVGFILNFFTIAVCAFTGYNLKRQSRNIRLQNSAAIGIENRAQEIRILQEKRFLNTIILVACVVAVCMIPASIFHQLLLFRSLEEKIILIVFNSLYYINFAVNPLIYVMRLPNYRKTFLRLYVKRNFAVEQNHNVSQYSLDVPGRPARFGTTAC
ncbi:melanocortin receptor 5-like [Dendronephthya gigantea]|uniref:melanocortin receptor 5-like n=1 Tax=Dendronephthya gigantea TaxID=151771 RepID=UPI00106C67DD|nr:melanocortin receptor 5-like [Dendronephthya gigantea]